MKLIKLASLLCPLLLTAGCVKTELNTPQAKFKTTRFLWEGKVSTVEVGTNGLKLNGYSSEASSLIESAARGAASGATK